MLFESRRKQLIGFGTCINTSLFNPIIIFDRETIKYNSNIKYKIKVAIY